MNSYLVGFLLISPTVRNDVLQRVAIVYDKARHSRHNGIIAINRRRYFVIG